MHDRYRTLFDLTDKVAVVMGAASGIGEASARTLAGLGARVVCADIDEDGNKATAGRILDEGGEALAVTANLASHDDVVAALTTASDRFGRLDVGVTTPAINIRKRIDAYSEEDLERTLQLNLKGTFYFLQRASTVMADQGSGSLIACSSMRSELVEPGLAPYAATKAAIQQLVRGLASEVGPAGVRVNTVAPGVIDTALTRPLRDKPNIFKAYNEHTILGRWGTADEVATAVAFLASDASSYITATNLPVDAGWTAIDGRFDPQR